MAVEKQELERHEAKESGNEEGVFSQKKEAATVRTEVVARIKLIADEGKVLTDGENFGRIIFLGDTGKPEDWREIREDEYVKIKGLKGR